MSNMAEVEKISDVCITILSQMQQIEDNAISFYRETQKLTKRVNKANNNRAFENVVTDITFGRVSNFEVLAGQMVLDAQAMNEAFKRELKVLVEETN